MKTIKQLLRQPLKTLLGMILMTLAVAVLCICVGQALAAQTTKKALDERFSTVAIPSVQEDVDGNVNAGSFVLNQETQAWLEKMAAEHPDIVKQVAKHGILSAYIPELTPLNITQDKYICETENEEYYGCQVWPYAMPYSCAMLVITLDEVSDPVASTVLYPVEGLTKEDFDSISDYYEWYLDPETEKMEAVTSYTVNLTGTVTDVVSLAEGYRDPVGRVARLTFTARTLEEVEALELTAGEQYIVYGMDYVDEFWALVGTLNKYGEFDHLNFEPYDPELFRYLPDWEIDWHRKKAEKYPDEFGYLVDKIAEYNGGFLSAEQVLQLNAISMTLSTPVSENSFEVIRDEETGMLLEVICSDQITYSDNNGNTVTSSIEAYIARYQIPTIAKLDGSVADFLNGAEGAAWKTALELASVNHQAFTILGVDKMSYLADFSLERARIVAGREFTTEELENGARVCIIHESLAQANGLQVGDTFAVNFYSTDNALPYQQFRTDGKGVLNPSASFYFSTTPFAETGTYTVVGIWRGTTLWPDVAEDAYAFSPNTVFVPRSSVQTVMETADSVLFNTLVLENGKIEDFHLLARKSGYAGRFKYYDQDYDTIVNNFHNYEELAKHVLIVGAAVYVILLMLFLMLYPGSQKKSVKTMHSLGSGYLRRFGHVWTSSMGIVIPASVFGCLLGTQLWDRIILALQAAAESNVALQLEPGTLMQIAGAQLVLALLMNMILALFVAAPSGISSRR